MPDNILLPSASDPENKLDSVLQYCIDNRERYLPETVEGALVELQKRGVEFSEEEIRVIEEDMAARRGLATNSNLSGSIFSNAYKNNFIDDPDAHSLYSRQVIRVFTLFFGVLFGSVMMAINIGKTKNQNGVLMVILFGIGFTFLQLIIATYANLNSISGIFLGFIAAYSIDYFFWNKYIGNETLYRAKSYLVPFIVAMAIYIPLLIAAYNAMKGNIH